MGRHPLLILAVLAGACVPAAPPEAGSDPHASLACAECHQGGLADRELAAVPTATCTASACHGNAVPGEITLQSVRFTHRGHGSTDALAVGCAGCHTHESGDDPIRAGPGTCGLCHADQLSGEMGEDCRLCHTSPENVGVTSQGVAVPHQGLPWIEGGCLRCHYQVSHPVPAVSLASCASCHQDVEAITELGIGEDLHPDHAGVSCASCHEADNHQIDAMTSAVNLTCSHCHTVEHDVEVAGHVEGGTCAECHDVVHAESQRVLLGIVTSDVAARPSDHFMTGLTCRSCHVSDAAPVEGRRPGSGEACVACHRAEYATVADWWAQGVQGRQRLVDTYLRGAERAVAGRDADDPSVVATVQARELLDLIAAGGGHHNLPLTHRALEDVLSDATEAYRLAGRGSPDVPRMGRAPRQGLCSYCHYRLNEPGMSEEMDDGFHQEVMGR